MKAAFAAIQYIYYHDFYIFALHVPILQQDFASSTMSGYHGNIKF